MTEPQPESKLQALCIAHKLTLATAESCTGGLVGHRITNVAGSSDYFVGGIISYSNDVKMKQLDVRESTLIEHGAVSEATVREMSAGAAAALEADVAIAISGIAGPGGGSREKPVGLVHFCVFTPLGTFVADQIFPGDRETVKAAAAEFALQFTFDRIEENYGEA
jgi:PncC family amidohydrolase